MTSDDLTWDDAVEFAVDLNERLAALGNGWLCIHDRDESVTFPFRLLRDGDVFAQFDSASELAIFVEGMLAGLDLASELGSEL